MLHRKYGAFNEPVMRIYREKSHSRSLGALCQPNHQDELGGVDVEPDMKVLAPESPAVAEKLAEQKIGKGACTTREPAESASWAAS